MRFGMLKVDCRDATITEKDNIERELNEYVSKLEQTNNVVTDEQMSSLTSSVEGYFLFTYEKGVPQNLKYKYLIFDIRDGPNPVVSQLNEEVVNLEKEGRTIIRQYFVPRTNSAYVQVLLSHIPKKKEESTNAPRSFK